MADYKPSFPFSTAVELLTPTYTNSKGVQVKTFPDRGTRLTVSFMTYGGQESNVNGVYSVLDTASIETWYRPDITSECRIKLLATGQVYEILGKPENINMRNQFLKFKVRAVEGGA